MAPNSRTKPFDGDLLPLRDLIEERTGIYFSLEKLDRLEEPFKDPDHSLSRVALGEIIHAITADTPEGRSYLNQIVSAVTTNETYFFRIASHFEVLRNYLLPELIEGKRSRGRKTLRCWSAGCSTGEEPYSLAIVLFETLRDIEAWDITVLATDIDLQALQKAQEGIYRPWSFRGVEPEIIEKYFHAKNGKRFLIDDQIRSLVTFRHLNLKSDPYPSSLNGTAGMDVILCRNVTIYFRPETNEEVGRRFYGCLNEGGFLLMGAAEYSPQRHRNFEVRVFPESLAYQKPMQQHSSRAPKRTELPKPALPILPGEQPPTPAPAIERLGPSPDRGRQLPEKKKEPDLVDEAVELIAQGNVDRALMILAGLAEKTPQDVRICFLLGQIAADRHHLPEACHWLSRTLALNPLHLWAHYLLGLLWLHEGRTGDALQSFRKAVYIEPNFALGHFYLGQIYKEQGRVGKARMNFAAAKKILEAALPSRTLQGAEAMTAKQLLMLIDRELHHGG